MLIKALGHLLQIANLGIRFGSSQLSHNPVERGRHTLAPADLVILLRIFPQHDGRPANTAFAKIGRINIFTWNVCYASIKAEAGR